MFFKILLSLTLFFIFPSSSWTSCDLLMITYDTGDAMVIEAVAHELEQRIQTNEKFKYKILAFGTSYNKLKDNPHLLKVETCKNFSTDLPKEWKRDSTLPDETIDCILKEATPKKVLIGLASSLQAQFAQKASEQGIQTTGIYDAFHNPIDPENDFDKTVRRVVKSVGNIIVPYKDLKEPFQLLNPKATVHVLGQPNYETWKQDLAKYDPKETLKKLGYLDKKPSKIILLSGGYDKIYKDTFEKIFLKAAASLKDEEFLITLHPKLKDDDSYEKSKTADLKNIKIIFPKSSDNPNSFSTEEIANISDVIICVRSTTGIKAALSGQSVIYIDTDPKNYTNPLIEKGKIRQVSTAEDLIQALHTSQKSEQTLEEITNQIDMPIRASKNIADYLMKQ